MIVIRENICKKIPGSSSLFISFQYNEEIIRLIKNCDVYRYDKKTREWEVPTLYLSYILDNLVYYDNIELHILSEREKRQYQGLTQQHKTKLFDYQEEGVLYGLNEKDSWLLLDAPGLGKTLQLITLAEELKATRDLKHCLVICGVASLKTNWIKEIKKHSDLSCRILGERITKKGTTVIGTISERAEQLMNTIDEFFIVTNVETLRSDDVISAILNGPNEIDMIVVDEIHKAKSSTSQQGKNLLKLTKAKYKIGATGTLLLNNPLDAFVPLKWIGEEKSTLTTYKNFYCEFSDKVVGQVVGLKNLSVLKTQLESCSVRRTKDLLNLPPKTIIEEYVEMNDTHRKFYEDVQKGVKSEVDKVELTTKSILAMTTRLRQATACPSILTTNNITSSKIERATDLVEQIVSNGDKVVVFSTFRETTEQLYTILNKFNPVIMTGDTKESDIEKIKSKFQEDLECKVFIGTWQKAGTGITLTAANYMIFIDTPWTYGEFEQSQDRIHRIGTNDKVFIYNLICRDTIDERVRDIVNRKQAISDYVVDDKIEKANRAVLENFLENELKQYLLTSL